MTRELLTAAVLTSAVAAATAEPRAVTLERVSIGDRGTRTDKALTLLRPKGWQVNGGVTWYRNFVHQASFELTVADPNGPRQVEMFRTYWFTHMQNAVFPPKRLDAYMGQVWLEPHTPADMLEQVTIPGFRQQYRPKVVAREELKDLAKAFARNDGQEVRAARVRVAYTLDGVAVEEDFYLVLSYLRTRTADLGDIWNWSPVIMPFAVRAEKGKLDAASPTLLSVAFSINPTPEFFKSIRLAQLKFQGDLRKMQDITRRDAAAVFEHYRSINAISRDLWADRAASNERRYRTTNDLLGGVAPYTDGSGTVYVLPHSHKYQWAGTNDTVILTDDPNFDPNVGSRYTWERLTETRR